MSTSSQVRSRNQSAAFQRSFSLEDCRDVWLVRSGEVDIFLERILPGGEAGARQFLLRVATGSAMFGLGFPIGNETNVVARLSLSTDTLQIPYSEFLAMLAYENADARQWLGDWVNNLALAVSSVSVSVKSISIQPGKTYAMPLDTRAVIPNDGLLWVQHGKGESWFQGNRALEKIDGKQFFPITKACWLEAAPRSALSGLTTQSVLAIDHELESLRRFHRAALQSSLINREQIYAKERLRIKIRGDNDDLLMARSLETLADTLEPSLTEPRTADEVYSDPLFAVCQAVGLRLGIKIKPHPDMLQGRSFSDPVVQIARASGIRLRRITLKGDWWRDDGGPLVAYRDKDNRPLALLPTSADSYEMFDPADRTSTNIDEEAASTLNPLAWMFYKPFPASKITFVQLIKFGLSGCGGEIRTVLWTSLVAGLLAIAIPFATAIIFNSYIPASERTSLIQTSVFLLVIVLTAATLNLARNFAVLRLEGKMDAAVQAAVWDRLLNLPIPFFRNYSSGDLAMRSLGIAYIRRTVTGPVLSSMLSGVFSVFSFGLLFYYNWRLALVATALVLASLLVSATGGYFQIRYVRVIFSLKGRTTGIVAQFIHGISKLRVAGADVRAFAAWAHLFSAQRNLEIRSRSIANVLAVFDSVFPVVCYAVLFRCGAMLMADLTLPPFRSGDFLAFLMAFTQFLSSSMQLTASSLLILKALPLYERARPILHTLPEVDAIKSTPTDLAGAIEVNNLTFRYKPDGPAVLRGIFFRIEPGEFVAFVGPSGCGKSTLFRLLLGFEHPEIGAVYYDGQDLTSVDVQAVRRQLGVVLQNSRIASGDLVTNIIGSHSLTVQDAWEAARSAGFEEDIKQMPMGMYTMISEGGGGLSGGQRQRLLIARALVNKPRIILFDEATSALDNRTQLVVSNSLENLRSTRIVIAHRLSTIVKADKIFVMDRGSIVQSGTYDQLMQEKGLFSKLAARQLV